MYELTMIFVSIVAVTISALAAGKAFEAYQTWRITRFMAEE